MTSNNKTFYLHNNKYKKKINLKKVKLIINNKKINSENVKNIYKLKLFYTKYIKIKLYYKYTLTTLQI
jgi:hypothetical protein